MIQTTDYVAEGERIGLLIDPDAIHIMKKSEYSGLYGDYSTFSDELEELQELEKLQDVEKQQEMERLQEMERKRKETQNT